MNKRSLFYALASVLIFTTSYARTWDLVDVSVLYPLSNHMLGTGDLLPLEVYNKHPLDPIYGTVLNAYDVLKVVGIRFDPGQKQIRLVWQPIVVDTETNQLSAEDRAAHTFYQLNSSAYKNFLEEWTRLQDQFHPNVSQFKSDFKSQGASLGIHPAFLKSSLSAKFSTELARILTHYCTSKNLIQYTAMQLKSGDHTWWSFAGIQLNRREPTQDKWKEIDIPNIKASHVDYFNMTTELNPQNGEVTALKGQFNFGGDDQVELAEIVKGYYSPDDRYKPIFTNSLLAIARLQNPHLTSAENIDCVSCHIAQPVRFWLDFSYGETPLPGNTSLYRFNNPNPALFDLNNNTIAAQSTRILRAFGYFGSKPAINQRVINESALSADFLNHQR